MAIYGLPYTDHELLVLQNISLPGWIALALFPKSKYAQGFAVLASFLAGLVYVATLGTAIYEGKASDFTLETFTNLDSLCQLFSQPRNMLPAWIHYIAFDLLAGVWICQDAAKRNVPHLLLPPCLFLALMLGPTGLVMYIILRLPFGAKEGKEKAA